MARRLIYKWLSIRTKTRREGLISKFLRLVAPLIGFLEKIGLRFLVDFAVAQSIRAYQKYLSPRKGFSCAYSRLYKSDSCSEYFRQMVKIYGLKKAIPLFQKRLRECKIAHVTLKTPYQCGKKHPKY